MSHCRSQSSLVFQRFGKSYSLYTQFLQTYNFVSFYLLRQQVVFSLNKIFVSYSSFFLLNHARQYLFLSKLRVPESVKVQECFSRSLASSTLVVNQLSIMMFRFYPCTGSVSFLAQYSATAIHAGVEPFSMQGFINLYIIL